MKKIILIVLTGLFIAFIALSIYYFIGFESKKVVLSSIPHYPNSTLLSEGRTTWPDDTPGLYVTYQSTDSHEMVIDFYLSKMKNKGWQLNSKDIPDDPAVPKILTFSKNRHIVKFFIGGAESFDLIRIRLERK